ncbi:tripartite tricarboxylate transporter permease [soil metagenome]
MDLLHSLNLGFSVALDPMNLLYCFLGVLFGTLVGVLPGLGSAGAIALLLPVTYQLTPTAAIIMLAGIWYGSMYGGSTTSILLRIPGEPASVMTCVDGFEMARRGRAGAALGIAAFGSFIAGTLGLVGLILLAPPLAQFALDFGPPEYLALTVLGLTLVSYLGSDSSLPKALAMAALGLLLGMVGLDPVQSEARFTFGNLSLQGGIELVPMVMGLFGVSQLLQLVAGGSTAPEGLEAPKGLRAMLPTRREWRDSAGSITRGSLLGFFVGLLPGAGGTISSFAAYALEKRVSKHPERFGQGAIEGVAAPESANNAATASGFIPLLTLGLPANAVMALMLGAFMLHGITPGPTLLTQKPDMFWGLIVSMFVGNVMLLVLNVPMIGLFAKVARMRVTYLVPVITVACMVGAYGVNNNPVDILVMLGFGVFGYYAEKFGFSPAPLTLAFVLGPLMEMSLRQSLILSGGEFGIFVSRPISGVLLGFTVLMVIVPIARHLLGRRGARSPSFS